jgi:flagellin-like hook-associated protein FlgL
VAIANALSASEIDGTESLSYVPLWQRYRGAITLFGGLLRVPNNATLTADEVDSRYITVSGFSELEQRVFDDFNMLFADSISEESLDTKFLQAQKDGVFPGVGVVLDGSTGWQLHIRGSGNRRWRTATFSTLAVPNNHLLVVSLNRALAAGGLQAVTLSAVAPSTDEATDGLLILGKCTSGVLQLRWGVSIAPSSTDLERVSVFVERNLHALMTELTTASSDIDTLQSTATSLDGRVDTLETDVATAQSTANGAVSDASDAANAAAAVASDLAAVDVRLTAAESTVGSLGTRMDTAESDIDGAESDITTLQGRANNVDAYGLVPNQAYTLSGASGFELSRPGLYVASTTAAPGDTVRTWQSGSVFAVASDGESVFTLIRFNSGTEEVQRFSLANASVSQEESLAVAFNESDTFKGSVGTSRVFFAGSVVAHELNKEPLLAQTSYTVPNSLSDAVIAGRFVFLLTNDGTDWELASRGLTSTTVNDPVSINFGLGLGTDDDGDLTYESANASPASYPYPALAATGDVVLLVQRRNEDNGVYTGISLCVHLTQESGAGSLTWEGPYYVLRDCANLYPRLAACNGKTLFVLCSVSSPTSTTNMRLFMIPMT